MKKGDRITKGINKGRSTEKGYGTKKCQLKFRTSFSIGLYCLTILFLGFVILKFAYMNPWLCVSCRRLNGNGNGRLRSLE